MFRVEQHRAKRDLQQNQFPILAQPHGLLREEGHGKHHAAGHEPGYLHGRGGAVAERRRFDQHCRRVGAGVLMKTT